MDEETEANPADGDEVTAEQAQLALNPEEGAEASEEPAIEDELDKLAGLDAQEGEPETVDIEINGKTYQVHKDLKDGYLMQADYTKKTMSVSEERKAVEAEKARIEEISSYSQESRASFVEAAALRVHLKELEDTPIDGLTQEQRNTLILRHQILERNIAQLEDRGKQAVDNERHVRSQQFAKAREAVVTETAKHIPNFTDQRRTELEAVAVSLGASPDEVQRITDPLVYKTLHLADIGQKFIERQRKAKNIADAQQVKPAAQVGGKARTDKSPDAMSPAEMAKHLGY